MNQATIIADSKNEFGQRITSMVVTFPRFLLAEMNTHRMLSRNSASSRAIKFENMVGNVMHHPFIPFEWQKDHPGMQGKELIPENTTHQAIGIWNSAAKIMIQHARALNKDLGVTKQLCNRLLEPFMYHTALITATEFENFFALRVSEHAEIHFQDIAQKMLDAMNASEPRQLEAGEWHVPFGDKFNKDDLMDYGITHSCSADSLAIKIATVRCARISYLTQGKETSIEEDLKLHDRLASSGHWSAFEHCARAMSKHEFNSYAHYSPAPIGVGAIIHYPRDYGWCGNFRGFIQYRKMFTDENRSDPRLIQK